MGFKKLYEVWCDGKDCCDWAALGRDLPGSVLIAQQAGWVRRGKRWLCPHCRKKES